MYQYLFFDLDGTITDSAMGIVNSVEYALKKCGITDYKKSELLCFVGPPLWESFEVYFGFTKEGSNKAVHYFREYYKEKGMYENKVYVGVEALLKRCKEEGKHLVLATSKVDVFAKEILGYFHLDSYFEFIAGASIDGKRVNKDEVIAYAMEMLGITKEDGIIMIGDRKHDIIGAKKTGIPSVGVLYGYGTKEEFQEFGADHIVKTPEELRKIILQ